METHMLFRPLLLVLSILIPGLAAAQGGTSSGPPAEERQSFVGTF